MAIMKTVMALGALIAASISGAQDNVKMKHETAQVNGIRMHYVTQGEGPTILFLHGFPEFWYEWNKQIAYFGDKGFQAVACDMRGYNLTEKPTRLEDYAIPVL